MDDNNNPITKPTKVYTITYDANGQGATFTPTPAESVATFNGYFTESSGGTKLIDENGYINYNEIEQKLYEYNPKLLIVGGSAYPRTIDFERIIDLERVLVNGNQYFKQ